MPKRVTALGGIFMKCADPNAMREWYATHLGFSTEKYGTVFEWRHAQEPNKMGSTVWNAFPKDTKYFEPSQKEFMLNLRVENMDWLLEELKKEGINQIGEMQTYEYGKFAHIVDPEGNKIELWEPIDEFADNTTEGGTTQ